MFFLYAAKIIQKMLHMKWYCRRDWSGIWRPAFQLVMFADSPRPHSSITQEPIVYSAITPIISAAAGKTTCLWPRGFALLSVSVCTQELQLSAQSMQKEREEVKSRMEESTARLLQLEEDMIGVTQKGLLKETELDGCDFLP